MNCPYCLSNAIKKLNKLTMLGYPRYYCHDCRKHYNERTGTCFNYIEHRSEVVTMTLYHYYRFNVSLDKVVELMAMRGISLSHQTVHNWVHTVGKELGVACRLRRKGRTCKKWHVDATYIKVSGHWCYLYRAIDKFGRLIDVYLSEKRDQEAAETFFKQALDTVEEQPDQITTDKEAALYPAIKQCFSQTTIHRDSKFMNNIIEQDHRGIKSRYRSMKGFKSMVFASNFCKTFEEIRDYLSLKGLPRSKRRRMIAPAVQDLLNLVETVA